MSIELTTLASGLRIITDTVQDMESMAVGVWADVGTRHEDLSQNGIAHMVEHMMFKGTPTRTAAQIAEQVEDVGGDMNAYTSREMTAYFIRLLKEDMPVALDILADIIQNPVFPEEEIERERGVIIQEIGMTNDTPDDIVFDHYQETAYPGQALGAPILGRSDIIKAISQKDLFDYIHQFYTPARLVISAAGPVDHDAFVREVEKRFTKLPANNNKAFIGADYQGGEHRAEKTLEQSHIVLGFQGMAKPDEHFHAGQLMSVILGGGMSSRLFQEVREKRGLVYSVYSSAVGYHDDGQFEIYAGTGPESLPELIPVLCDEVRKIQNDPVHEEELARAKAQVKASMLMSRESMMSRANRQAQHLVTFNRVLNIPDLVSKIEAVSLQDIQNAAKQIFSKKPTLSALGPLSKLESYDQIQGRLAG